MTPNFNEEKKLWKQGIDVVIGLDEAGRGPLAGPVVAAAIFLQKNCRVNIQVNDSKKLSEKKREELYEVLTNHSAVKWGIGIVSEKIVDEINILQATKLAMQKALKNLEKNLYSSDSVKRKAFQITPLLKTLDFLLIDGNFSLQAKIPQKSVIKGDQKVFSIAAASIIAKVTRDRLMRKMHKKYPQYRFDLHKGYGTALHIKNLKNFGPCKIHRKSFSYDH